MISHHSPCRRYLLALLLQGWTVQQVEEHALLHQLDYISIQSLVLLCEQNLPPEIFRPRDLAHEPSQGFLRERDLVGEVPRPSPLTQQAFRLAQNKKGREVLELAALGGLPEAEILQLLQDARVRTQPEVVRHFYRMFFDVQGCDRTELRAILMLRQPDLNRLQYLQQLEQAAAAVGGAVAPLRPLPAPHDTHTRGSRARARTRRANAQADLVRQLEESTPIHERVRHAEILKRASYTDPRLVVAALPPSPLSIALSRAALGLPLTRFDLQKAYDILITLSTLRVTEAVVDRHPESANRLAALTASVRTLQTIYKEFGASQANLAQQVQAIAIKYEHTTHYGELKDRVGPDFRTNPYSLVDAEAAKEMVAGASSPDRRGSKDKAVEEAVEETNEP